MCVTPPYFDTHVIEECASEGYGDEIKADRFEVTDFSRLRHEIDSFIVYRCCIVTRFGVSKHRQ